MRYLLILIFAMATLSLLASADTLYTKDGKELKGQVYEKDGLVWVKTDVGEYAFNKSEVKEVRYTTALSEEYLEKLNQTDAKDLKANEELLKWCESKGMKNEARNVAARIYPLREALINTDPLDQKATDELGNWCLKYNLNQEARKEFLKIYNDEVKTIPEDAWNIHFSLGKWCEERGLMTEAKHEYRAVLVQQPDNEYCRTFLGYVKEAGKWMMKESEVSNVETATPSPEINSEQQEPQPVPAGEPQIPEQPIPQPQPAPEPLAQEPQPPIVNYEPAPYPYVAYPYPYYPYFVYIEVSRHHRYRHHDNYWRNKYCERYGRDWNTGKFNKSDGRNWWRNKYNKGDRDGWRGTGPKQINPPSGYQSPPREPQRVNPILQPRKTMQSPNPPPREKIINPQPVPRYYQAPREPMRVNPILQPRATMQSPQPRIINPQPAPRNYQGPREPMRVNPILQPRSTQPTMRPTDPGTKPEISSQTSPHPKRGRR